MYLFRFLLRSSDGCSEVTEVEMLQWSIESLSGFIRHTQTVYQVVGPSEQGRERGF